MVSMVTSVFSVVLVAVIDQLDVLKKESAGARDAIRWLEAEFKKGNRCASVQLLLLLSTFMAECQCVSVIGMTCHCTAMFV